jgi:hypothetical protein
VVAVSLVSDEALFSDLLYRALAEAIHGQASAFHEQEILPRNAFFGDCSPTIIEPVFVNLAERIGNCMDCRSFGRGGELDDI